MKVVLVIVLALVLLAWSVLLIAGLSDKDR
jgi:hypothetical protein